jgi:pilus assembly protein CpaB
VQSTLQIPADTMAASVNLTDPARVAGFVNPGSEVAVFWTGASAGATGTGLTMTKILLTRVTVLGVGSTTPVSTTTTDESGASTTEQLPRTLLTLSLTQAQTQKVLLGAATGELAFGLLTDDSVVADAPETTSDTLFK